MQPETAPAQTSMMTCANFTKSAEEPNITCQTQSLLDGVQKGRIRWQIDHHRAGFFNPFVDRWRLVSAQVVHYHHVAVLQHCALQMFDIGQENIGIGGLFNSHGCYHAAQALGTENRHDHPVTSRRRLMDTSASLASRTEPRHRSRSEERRVGKE